MTLINRLAIGPMPLVAAFAVVALGAASPASAQTAELPPGGTFEDEDGSTHEGMIEALVADGITAGCSADGWDYCPSETVTGPDGFVLGPGATAAQGRPGLLH